jgi:hypothetical protein
VISSTTVSSSSLELYRPENLKQWPTKKFYNNYKSS